jgi:hypothetical protein
MGHRIPDRTALIYLKIFQRKLKDFRRFIGVICLDGKQTLRAGPVFHTDLKNIICNKLPAIIRTRQWSVLARSDLQRTHKACRQGGCLEVIKVLAVFI